MLPRLATVCLALLLVVSVRAEDGYRLWLRYDRITNDAFRTSAASATHHIIFATSSGEDSPTLVAARAELTAALNGLLGFSPKISTEKSSPSPLAGDEGYALYHDAGALHITANRDLGVLYGAFALIREIQLGHALDHLDLATAPRIQRRLLNHWDNLNRFVERGYAGSSLWEWFVLPDHVSPRMRDYARACASIGINGTVLNNVNADTLILTPDWLRKVAALADTFRPYGVRVYLSARFSAPKEIGGLPTADPLDPAVIAWWRAKADEIYRVIPDFGGWLVKANSEGQPGPQDYGRTHVDGANLLAAALAPHGGIVIWRAFVYSHETPDDRAKQAYTEFQGLDGKFRDNVLIQIKNGPIDFMPREPFHPLFGAMPHTPLALELQITQEYLGQSTQLAFLAPMWKETLAADTFTAGPGSTVARVIDGTADHHPLSAIAGVANTGTDRNWTGHPLAQANWYAFGRLAWDHMLTSETIADEWTRLTFGSDPRIVTPVTGILLASRETVVDYSMPLGLHHIMAEGHHYGPGPWVDKAGRADWTSVYYHHADSKGIGFDRTVTGSNALAQYAPEVARRYGDLATCPENLLLWFHHVSWDHRLASGSTLWEELCLHEQHGVETVRRWQSTWASLASPIDPERHTHVRDLLNIQERDARAWRDASLQYFQTFSKLPLPAGVEQPAHPLAYYRAINLRAMPGSPGGK
jgi:alpha-glucuronidase